MSNRSLFRDLSLLAFAGALGWWAHTGVPAVHADSNARSSNSNSDGIGFQIGGTKQGEMLTVYSPGNHTLYVYPLNVSNNHINCSYSLKIDRMGGPIERENCPMGATLDR